MTRYLYILNTETGEKTGHVNISDMKPIEIIAAEARMWAQIEGEGFVVRDSALD